MTELFIIRTSQRRAASGRSAGASSGDDVRGFLTGREDPDREAAEARDIFCSESGSDATTVLVIVPIDHVMDTFETPMPAVDGRHPLRRGLLRVFGIDDRGGSGNSDSVISGSLASPKPPGGGEPEERGNEENTTESRGHV